MDLKSEPTVPAEVVQTNDFISPGEENGSIKRKESLSSQLGTSPTGLNPSPACTTTEALDSCISRAAGGPNLFKCNICLCELSSDAVLTSHINGSRHKKRVKALEIIASLKAAGEDGIDFNEDNVLSSYRCELCALTVNSPQQLEFHLAGAKHKHRIVRDKIFNIANKFNTPKSQDDFIVHSTPLRRIRKDNAYNSSLFCDVCNVMLNSETQYEQHVLSRKHIGRTKVEICHEKKIIVLENKSDDLLCCLDRTTFSSSNKSDRNMPFNNSSDQQFSKNMNEMQEQSSHNVDCNVGFNHAKCHGVNNGTSLRNFYRSKPYMTKKRYFEGNHSPRPDLRKYFRKGGTLMFSVQNSSLQAPIP